MVIWGKLFVYTASFRAPYFMDASNIHRSTSQISLSLGRKLGAVHNDIPALFEEGEVGGGKRGGNSNNDLCWVQFFN